MKAQITIVLNALSENAHWNNINHDLKVYHNPYAVVAKRDFKAGEITLVPATQFIKTRLPDQKAPDRAIDLGELVRVPRTLFHLMPQFAAGKGENQNFVSPFWCVPFANQVWQPNLTTVWMTHKINLHLKTGDDADEMEVKLPMLKNHRKVKEGEMLYQGVPVPHETPSSEIGSPAKRSRR
eukprot:8865141-Pyramimonas_sp.AAC.1